MMRKPFRFNGWTTGKSVAGQVDRTAGPRVVWLLDKELKAGASRRYRLAASKGTNRKANAVTIRDDGKTLQVFAKGKPVLHYNQATVESPDPKTPFYARSGYIHPLFNPAGQVLTDDFAPDHPHQHGVFFAWTNTTFEGRDINFWDQRNQQGSVEHVKVTEQVSGPVFGGFTAILRHVDPESARGTEAGVDGIVAGACLRAGRGRFYSIWNRCSDVRGESPLRINKYHYGAMAIRCRREWLKPGAGDFLDQRREDQKGRQSYAAELGGHLWRFEAFAHGRDTVRGTRRIFGIPQPVRLHPSKPYFCFAPLVSGPFEIQPGDAYTSRYRFFVHNGKPDVKRAENILARLHGTGSGVGRWPIGHLHPHFIAVSRPQGNQSC